MLSLFQFVRQLFQAPPVFRRTDVKSGNSTSYFFAEKYNECLSALFSVQEMCRLHELAQDGNEAELANLLESGADINERDSDGSTPLHFACDSGSVKVMFCISFFCPHTLIHHVLPHKGRSSKPGLETLMPKLRHFWAWVTKDDFNEPFICMSVLVVVW